jgi:hypothetical protein
MHFQEPQVTKADEATKDDSKEGTNTTTDAKLSNQDDKICLTTPFLLEIFLLRIMQGARRKTGYNVHNTKKMAAFFFAYSQTSVHASEEHEKNPSVVVFEGEK